MVAGSIPVILLYWRWIICNWGRDAKVDGTWPVMALLERSSTLRDLMFEMVSGISPARLLPFRTTE